MRISREELYKQVFTIKKYFPGISRKWEPQDTILLVRKAEYGDSLVGYGVERYISERQGLKTNACTVAPSHLLRQFARAQTVLYLTNQRSQVSS